MKSWRTFLLFIAVIGALLLSTTNGLAQKNSAEEKREAEKIRDAEQALSKAKQELNASEKKFTEINNRAIVADKREDTAKAAIGKARQAAEDKLEDSTGLPKTLRAIDTAKKDFEALALPLREAAKQTPSYQTALQSATAAEVKKAELREDTTLTDQELAQALVDINKVIRQPTELLEAAVLQDRAAAKAHGKVAELLKTAAEQREKIRDRIDSDPGLKKAVAEYQDAIKDHQQALRDAAQARSAVLRERQQVAAAANRVASAKAADKRDDQQDKNKGKNNKGKKN